MGTPQQDTALGCGCLLSIGLALVLTIWALWAHFAQNNSDAVTVTLTTPDKTTVEGTANATAQLRLSLSRALVTGENLAVPLAFSGGSLGADFNLALAGAPAGVALSEHTVTFTGQDRASTTTTLILSAANDDDATDETVTVAIPSSSSGDGPILAATGLKDGATGHREGNGQITITDDDTAGVTVNATKLSVATDDTATYTVVLDSAPASTVVITPTSGSKSKAGVSNALTFTDSNWDVPQTVVVRGLAQGRASINHAVTTGDGGDYPTSLIIGSVAVAVTPVSTVGVSGHAVMTGGSNAMFVVLVIAMVLITISAFSAGDKARLQIRRLRETMASGIVLSPSEAGETPTTHKPQDPDYPRHLLQRGLDHLLAALQASDQALTADTSHWLSYQARARWLGKSVGLRQLMDWTQKAPAFLISLGLLGTFIGLTIALEDIGQILRPELPPDQILGSLKEEILTPMGTAFWSSLLGLAFSLLIRLNNQTRGRTTAIDNLELDLSHFFDGQLGNLQQRDATQGLSPVRKEMAGVVKGLETFQKKIEATAESFGNRLIQTVDQAVERTMAAHLDELQSQSLVIAEEARQAVVRIGEIANRLSEAGQDFIGAAAAFRDTDFATALHESVQRMFENQESLAKTTESLCERMGLLRESLTRTQMDWQTLTVVAEQELKTASTASAASRKAAWALVEASAQLSQGRDQLTAAQEGLQTASEAICAISGTTAELTKALTDTLEVDQALGNSVAAVCSTLGTAIQSWSTSVQRTDQLASDYVEQLQAATGKYLKDLQSQGHELRSVLSHSRSDLVEFVNDEAWLRLASMQQVDQHANRATSALGRLSSGLQELNRLVAGNTWNSTSVEKVTAMEHGTEGDGN